MHEFSLAQNIIGIVEDTLKQHRAERVSVVELEIGSLAGVEIDALDMALQSLQPGSVIEAAVIEKVIIRALARCQTCDHEFEPDDIFAVCPSCGNFGAAILKGKELRVKSITAE